MLYALLTVSVLSSAVTWVVFMRILRRRSVSLEIEGLAGAVILPLLFGSVACTGAATEHYGAGVGLLAALGTAPVLVVVILAINAVCQRLFSATSGATDWLLDCFLARRGLYCGRCQLISRCKQAGRCVYCECSTNSCDELICAACSRRLKRCAYCRNDLRQA